MYSYRGNNNHFFLIFMVLLISSAGLVLISRQNQQPVRVSGWPGMSPESQAVLSNATNGLSGVANQQGRGLSLDLRPSGNPLRAANTVMTQGYGVGTHAPAQTWGAVDLALDGNGDGAADPEGSWSHPVYATHSGVIQVTADSWPAGNHIWVFNEQYRTGYAHLQQFAVENGQVVQAGQIIGYMGSTGMSSGPHLDYQVWERQGEAWINLNPLDFGVFD
jgi:murein DD-endopeptidase MepM/ murein hydrolase activator NlpD